jgi:hypothetical protein
MEIQPRISWIHGWLRKIKRCINIVIYYQAVNSINCTNPVQPFSGGCMQYTWLVAVKVFFLDLLFLPEGTGITGYREISEIPLIYRTNFLNKFWIRVIFTPKQREFVSILLRAIGLAEWSRLLLPTWQFAGSNSGKCIEAVLPYFLQST